MILTETVIVIVVDPRRHWVHGVTRSLSLHGRRSRLNSDVEHPYWCLWDNQKAGKNGLLYLLRK